MIEGVAPTTFEPDLIAEPGTAPRGAPAAPLPAGRGAKSLRLGGARAYEVRVLGTIVRCPSCDNARIRLAHNRGRYLVDLRGTRYLRIG